MKKSLLKDAFRQIVMNPGRFLAIFAIVAIGTAFFAGIKAAAPNMKYTADQYYDEYNMMDVRVLSTLGLVSEDIAAVKAVEGVKDVQPSYFVDVTTTIDTVEFVFRVHSLPAKSATTMDFINAPKIVDGRLPVNEGECIIEVNKSLDLGLRIGDTISVESGKAEPVTDTLKHDTYKIVGTAVSPYYLTYDKDASDIGSGNVNFFMMVPESEFLYPVYTEILLTIDGAKAENSYSNRYSELVEKVTNRLENLGDQRAGLRLAEIKAKAYEELNKAKAELQAQETSYNQQIADAENRLAAARDELVSGQATLEGEKRNAALQIQFAEYQIAQGEADLAQAEQDYADSLAQYNQFAALYQDSQSSVDSGLSGLQSLRSYLVTQKASLQLQLADPTLTADQIADLNSQIADLDSQIAQVDSVTGDINNLNSNAGSQLEAARAQLDAAEIQLAQARIDLDNARAQLAQEKINAANAFAAAEARLAAGQAEYDAAASDLAVKKAEGAKQIQDAKEKLIRAENEIERISEPTWYILDRTKLYSYADYAATADRMDAIAVLFPVFFFAVAALVSLTSMTRMIDEQRTSIGVYKALGYGNLDIAFKFVNYAAIASILGGTLGVFVGVNIFPKIIFDSWAIMYTLPPMLQTNHSIMMFLTVLAAAVLIVLTAYWGSRNELKAVPATLMRPKAGLAGKTILLEKIHWFWNRLNFTQKVTMRNIFRYKKRFIMTIIGIAGCAALMVAGFGIRNSIGQVVQNQYNELFQYDMSAKFSPDSTKQERDLVYSYLTKHDYVEAYMKVSQMNASVKGEDEEISATMISPSTRTNFDEYILLRDRVFQNKISLPDDGIVINEKLAKELGVSKGDTISVNNGDGSVKKLEIAAITENYIFHYIYISPDYYEEIYGLKPDNNAILMKMAQNDFESQQQVGSDLIGVDQISSVLYYNDVAETFKDSIKSLDNIIYAIIVAAAILAFVVLYNLTNINISERQREIATIKVLGFYNMEVAEYVYRENMLLTFMGALIGLPVGLILHRLIMKSIEQDAVMFGYFISGWSLLIAFLITLVFGILVNIFMYRRLTSVKMVESLKSVE